MICGIDEAGRGCVAGDLCIAGCVLRGEILGLKDSKKLSEKMREKLYEKIIANAEYKIVVFSAVQIDERGLSACLREGLDEIIAYFKDKFKAKFDVNLKANLECDAQNELKIRFDTKSSAKRTNSNAKNIKFDENLIEIYKNSSDLHFIYDGNTSFGNQQISTCVKADAKITAVSAASILAKVTHDRAIKLYDAIAPQYALISNKGYASTAHIAAIAQFGYQNFHRKSYKIKALEGGIFD
jgi:ribonuclease HII